jgi:hypothetical protein
MMKITIPVWRSYEYVEVYSTSGAKALSVGQSSTSGAKVRR